MTIPPTDDEFSALERERLAALDDALTELRVLYDDYGIPNELRPMWLLYMLVERRLLRVDDTEPIEP